MIGKSWLRGPPRTGFRPGESTLDGTRGEMDLLHASTLVFSLQAWDEWPTVLDHCTRVASAAARVATALEVSDAALAILSTAARLHEIGIVGIPRQLLTEPGPLAPRQLRRIRRHAAIGAEIVRPTCGDRVAWLVAKQFADYRVLRNAPEVRETDVLLAGILRVADVFIAITSPRPYRPMPATVDWREVLDEGFGATFHPSAAGTLLNLSWAD